MEQEISCHDEDGIYTLLFSYKSIETFLNFAATWYEGEDTEELLKEYLDSFINSIHGTSINKMIFCMPTNVYCDEHAAHVFKVLMEHSFSRFPDVYDIDMHNIFLPFAIANQELSLSAFLRFLSTLGLKTIQIVTGSSFQTSLDADILASLVSSVQHCKIQNSCACPLLLFCPSPFRHVSFHEFFSTISAKQESQFIYEDCKKETLSDLMMVVRLD